MSLDEATWAEIARLWCEGREPVGSIAERFDVSRQRIVATARARQWPPREPASRDRPSAKADAGNAARASRTGSPHGRGAGTAPPRLKTRAGQKTRGAETSGRHKRRKPKPATRSKALQQMVERLFDAMETKLSNIEQRMAEGADDTPADSERTARSIGTLIRNLERLSEYEKKLHKADAAAGDKSGGERDDTERRRQELARRIARLLERR